jgi:hypothetical protein
MKFNLNEDGSKYMHSMESNMVTFQSNEPRYNDWWGSSNNWNRYWQQTFAQLIPKFLRIVTHFGINNQTFTNGGAAGVEQGEQWCW